MKGKSSKKMVASRRKKNIKLLGEINKRVGDISARLVKFRRELHSKPELSGAEEKTSAFVAGVLEDNDIEVTRGVGGYGVVGLLRGGKSSDKTTTVAVRADMDALPLQDLKKEVEYASKVKGVMHACGHDVHTAILLGSAIVLASIREELEGNVKFIFQPSEESSVGGAKFMIEEGVLTNPEPSAIFALHCYPELTAGRIGHRAGIMTASSDKLTIIIKGKSGHASRPHQTIDAVLVAALVINSIHHIVSRKTDPLHHAVISIGTIKGGSAPNIIADRVEMNGTVRTIDANVREKIPIMIEEVVKGVTTGMGADYEFKYEFGSSSVVNDVTLDEFVASCAFDVLGDDNVVDMPDPLMGAEDFSRFSERLPGVLFRLGTTNEEKGINTPLHSPEFDVDEGVLSIGTEVISWICARYLSEYDKN